MLTNAHVWREARERLRPQMTRAQFDTWLRGTQLVTLEQGSAVLAVPTTFAKELLESQYRARIEAALASVTGRAFTLRVVVSSQQEAAQEKADAPDVAVSVRTRVASRPLPATHERQSNQQGQRRTEDESGTDIAPSYQRLSLFEAQRNGLDGAAAGPRNTAHTDEPRTTSGANPQRAQIETAEAGGAPRPGSASRGAHAGANGGADGIADRRPSESGERSTRMSTSAERGFAGDDGERHEQPPRPDDSEYGQTRALASGSSGTHPLHGGPAGRSGVPAPRLNLRYTFKTFIVGSSNQLAYAASVAVGEAPGEAYNPLFLYGGVGLGKTHLLHAVGHAAEAQGLAVLYVTSETFTNEIVNAIRYRTTEEFRAKYRTADVLLVDDIQFIAGKDSTEEEFFHTFNSLYESGRQIVICSDHPPKAIVSLEERLRSRFEWGLIADMQPPDFGTRVAILRAKAEMMQRQAPDDVIDYLADRIQSNIRELEGSLNRLLAFSTLQRQPLTVELAKAAFATLASDARPRRISIAEVLAAVSEFYRISPDDLRGKQRDKHIVAPRHVAMYLMRQETQASLLEIGQALGGRDHSTVLHGCDKIGKEINENTALRKEIVTIRQRLQG